jgi:hypothetical protein
VPAGVIDREEAADLQLGEHVEVVDGLEGPHGGLDPPRRLLRRDRRLRCGRIRESR